MLLRATGLPVARFSPEGGWARNAHLIMGKMQSDLDIAGEDTSLTAQMNSIVADTFSPLKDKQRRSMLLYSS